MISLFQSIVDVITSVLNFVINMFKSLLVLLSHLPTYTDFLVSSMSYLPSVVLPFALASVSVYVILFILNRGK